MHIPDWEKVERMVGLPDYGVAFCLSPWPDGGWMAGVGIIDAEWVRDQADRTPPDIDPVMLSVPELSRQGEDWDLYDGFSEGVVVHGDDAADAVEMLWAKLHGDPDPLRRHQRERTGVRQPRPPTCPLHGQEIGPPPARNCPGCREDIAKTLERSRRANGGV